MERRELGWTRALYRADVITPGGWRFAQARPRRQQTVDGFDARPARGGRAAGPLPVVPEALCGLRVLRSRPGLLLRGTSTSWPPRVPAAE